MGRRDCRRRRTAATVAAGAIALLLSHHHCSHGFMHPSGGAGQQHRHQHLHLALSTTRLSMTSEKGNGGHESRIIASAGIAGAVLLASAAKSLDLELETPAAIIGGVLGLYLAGSGPGAVGKAARVVGDVTLTTGKIAADVYADTKLGSTITGVVGSTLASSIEVASDAVARGVRESLGESEQQLAMTLDKARKQVVSLKQELSNTSAELRESRAELDSLRSALSLVEDPQAVLEAERIYKEGLGKANDRATMLEKELGEIKIRAEEYSSSELAVKAELEKAQAQFSANENEMKQTIAQLQADLTAAKKVEQERDELSGAIKSLEVELGIAKQSAEDLADAQLLNQELAQATSALETELMTVKQDAETVKDAETALRAQLAEASKALKDSEQKEEQMRLSVSRLEADLEVTQTAAGAEESAKLREMADRVAELESKLAAESMDKQATAAQMTRDVKAADSRAASELKRSEELQMTLGKLETELKAVQEEKVELRTSAAADVAKLRSELAEARSLEKEVQEELTNVKSQLKAAQAQVGDRQEVRQTSSIATPASPAPAPQVPELAVAPQISVKPSVVLPSEVKVENAVPPKPQEAPESAAPMPAPPVASQELSTSQLMKKTVAELRELCKLAGVATTGKKRDLVDKLIQT